MNRNVILTIKQCIVVDDDYYEKLEVGESTLEDTLCNWESNSIQDDDATTSVSAARMLSRSGRLPMMQPGNGRS